MGRHRAMSAAPATGSPDSPISTAVQPPDHAKPEVGGSETTVLPPLTPEIDLERYERLGSAGTLRGITPRFVEQALESARRLQCLTPPCAPVTDADAVRTVARYLAIDAERMGAFSYRASLRRVNVNPYIDYMRARRKDRGVRAAQGQIFAVGRIVHPREFPARQTSALSTHQRTPAASPDRINELYALAPMLSIVLSQKVFTVLDCCLGAGARATDFRVLRGDSITKATWDNDPVAVVRLPNTAGGTRLVPVADVQVSERLLDLARSKGPRYLLGSANGHIERNVVNRVSSQLRTRGYPTLDAAGLRHRWLINLATHAPAALMLQLADVATTHILADQRNQLPTYGLQHAIALTKENHQ